MLVVVNKCDRHPHELNETRLMRDYPNIEGFIQTSCPTRQGIAELRREIGKQVRRLPHVFDELSESCFAGRRNWSRLGLRRTTSRSRTIAQSAGVTRSPSPKARTT